MAVAHNWLHLSVSRLDSANVHVIQQSYRGEPIVMVREGGAPLSRRRRIRKIQRIRRRRITRRAQGAPNEWADWLWAPYATCTHKGVATLLGWPRSDTLPRDLLPRNMRQTASSLGTGPSPYGSLAPWSPLVPLAPWSPNNIAQDCKEIRKMTTSASVACGRRFRKHFSA